MTEVTVENMPTIRKRIINAMNKEHEHYNITQTKESQAAYLTMLAENAGGDKILLSVIWRLMLSYQLTTDNGPALIFESSE
jgi:hypothetical protein